MISFELPFVDALGDGKTPFRYVYTQLIQVGTPSYAINVAERYGVPHIIPSVFDPECDAYQLFRPHSFEGSPVDLRGMPADASNRVVEVWGPDQMTREARPFYDEYLDGVINQPRFGVAEGGLVCGRTKVFFGEEVGFERLAETKGGVNLSGTFESLEILIDGGPGWNTMYGFRGSIAFVDDDFVDCKGLAEAVAAT
jgi:hypothetical protein